MEKNKREKIQKQLRMSLKTVVDLAPTLLTSEEQLANHFIAKVCPQIGTLHSLRILTVIEITYIIELYLQLIQKYHPLYLPDFKIGIIGGGVTARLILNSLLPLSKDGLSLNNIMVSTRQAQNLKFYTDNFGIRVQFDNQMIAAEADFLIVATPATLDNWIIADIKQILEERVHQTGKKQSYNINIPTASKIQSEKSQTNFLNQLNKKQLQQKNNPVPQKRKNQLFRPLVYILTSDFSQQKCLRYFSFPVLTPAVRAKDMSVIQQTLSMFINESADDYETHQKILSWWLFQDKNQSKQLESVDSQSMNEALSESKIAAFVEKYSKTRFQTVITALAFIADSTSQTISATSSVSNTISLSESAREKNKDQSLVQILEIASSQGDVQETYFKKLRKWRMAYNNFVA